MNWIKVEDRLPEVKDDNSARKFKTAVNVLVATTSKHIQTGFYYPKDKIFEDDGEGFELSVTHWMPLPNPPIK